MPPKSSSGRRYDVEGILHTDANSSSPRRPFPTSLSIGDFSLIWIVSGWTIRLEMGTR
jgi:hypothetical protein